VLEIAQFAHGLGRAGPIRRDGQGVGQRLREGSDGGHLHLIEEYMPLFVSESDKDVMEAARLVKKAHSGGEIVGHAGVARVPEHGVVAETAWAVAKGIRQVVCHQKLDTGIIPRPLPGEENGLKAVNHLHIAIVGGEAHTALLCAVADVEDHVNPADGTGKDAHIPAHLPRIGHGILEMEGGFVPVAHAPIRIVVVRDFAGEA
jgi:hypothetical protein